MLITKKIEIDMGHRVPNHKSKCRSPHGHRYIIEVGVDDKVITEKGSSDEGMVIDFGDLKEMMMLEIDAIYDHAFCLYERDELKDLFKQMKGMKVVYVPFVPTAENLARHWFNKLKSALEEVDIKIYHVRVWETPNSTATYTLANFRRDGNFDERQTRLVP